MEKLVIFLALIVLTQAQTALETAQRLCNTTSCRPGTAIACKYTTNTNMKCDGQLLPLDINYVLKMHNTYRNLIALGQVPKYKPANRMAEMRLHPDLIKMAEYNVKQCIYVQDQCRNTNDFRYSGQNVAIMQQKGIVNWDLADEIRRSIEKWFLQHEKGDMSFIYNFHNSPSELGRFTTMIVDSNNYLGCAATRFTDKNGYDTILLACNYAETTMYNQPVYANGQTATSCQSGTSANYTGLCSVGEVYN